MNPPAPPPTPAARSVALHVLLDCQRKDAFVQEILDRHLRQADLAPADRRLATELTYGVLRRRATLDHLLQPCIARAPHKVEAWLREILRLGAYQLFLLTHIPVHAALYETVELAAVLGKPRGKGFINAVLRKLLLLRCDETTAEPVADALPVETGRYRKLASAALPDPDTHRVEYVAAGFSWPRWLAERWLDRYGWEECVRLGFWFAGPTPLWLRCNLLRGDRTACLAAFHEAGIEAEAGDFPQAIRLPQSIPVRDLPGYAEGRFVVQDESATRVGAALAPQPGRLVLDLCAAPGGKTTHLAECMQNQGRIIACDIDDRRLQQVTDSCHRLGIRIVETCRLHPERNEEPPAGPFDAILVDVPCSNTGVLGKRPEARWRLKPEDFRHLVKLQTTLLTQAGERIKPGGAIVYSTCSIEPEENQQVVRTVLQARLGLALEAEEEQMPGRPTDGGYWARLRRK
jgi:16S rRNA (cytosine967-C5)-methyltransferase